MNVETVYHVVLPVLMQHHARYASPDISLMEPIAIHAGQTAVYVNQKLTALNALTQQLLLIMGLLNFALNAKIMNLSLHKHAYNALLDAADVLR
jgi:hypothetical protein